MTAQNELSSLIAKTVEEQTFSLDAIKAIGIIRDKAASLEAKLADANGEIVRLNQRVSDRDAQLTAFAEKERKMVEREGVVSARELKITELEKSTAVAQAKHEVLHGVFNTIFANRTVRESTLTTTPIMNPGHNGSAGYVSNYDTRNTIERTEG